MSASPDPYAALGIPSGATRAEARAAFAAIAKQTHPDTPSGGDRDAYEKAVEAWEQIVGKRDNHERTGDTEQDRRGNSGSDFANEGQDDEDILNAEDMIARFLRDENLIIRFDGSLGAISKSRAPNTIEEVKAAIGQREQSFKMLRSRLVLHIAKNNLKIGQFVLDAALDSAVEKAEVRRMKEVLSPLFDELSEIEHRAADEQWLKLAGVFNSMPALTIAVLKKFIYQVKRKSCGLPVERHLMPVIQNSVHGGGKTTFVNKLLEPIEELQSGPTLFSDYIDHRSADLYKYPVIFVDDITEVRAKDMTMLNSLITGVSVQRRVLNTMSSARVHQASTLIGTCNKDLAELLPDETGNRRFAVLPFKNGAAEKGGDPGVWATIDSIDFKLLWRSVDVLGTDPILPELDALERWQRCHRRRSTLEKWLQDLDVLTPEVLIIRHPRGILVSDLFRLFQQQTKELLTLAKFGTELGKLITNRVGPFVEKKKLEGGVYCILPSDT